MGSLGQWLPVDGGPPGGSPRIGSLEDPLAEQPKFFSGQGRRFDLVGERGHRRGDTPGRERVEGALVWLFRHDRGATLAPLQDAFHIFEDQPVLVDRHVVARQALGVEDRVDVFLEVNRPAELGLDGLDRLGVGGLLGVQRGADKQGSGPQGQLGSSAAQHRWKLPNGGKAEGDGREVGHGGGLRDGDYSWTVNASG